MLDLLVKEIQDFQRVTFPNGTLRGAAEHLKEETFEIIDAIERGDDAHAREETADALFLVVQIMTLLGGDLERETRKKLNKNRKRKWGKPDEYGRIKHV